MGFTLSVNSFGNKNEAALDDSTRDGCCKFFFQYKNPTKISFQMTKFYD